MLKLSVINQLLADFFWTKVVIRAFLLALPDSNRSPKANDVHPVHRRAADSRSFALQDLVVVASFKDIPLKHGRFGAHAAGITPPTHIPHTFLGSVPRLQLFPEHKTPRAPAETARGVARSPETSAARTNRMSQL